MTACRRLLVLLVALAAAAPAVAQDVSRALVALGDGASGVFVERGLVATAADALGDRHIVQVRLASGGIVLAQVVASDPRTGVALLRVPGDAGPEAMPELRIDRTASPRDDLLVATASLAGVRQGARVQRVSPEKPTSYEVDLPQGARVAGSALIDRDGRLVALVTRLGVGSGPAHAASAASVKELLTNPRGRPPSAGTAGPASTGTPVRPPESAAGTETPRVGVAVAPEAAVRALVLRDLDRQLIDVAREVTAVGNLDTRYRSSCVGQYLVPVGGSWPYPWLIEKTELPECRTLQVEVERRLAGVRTTLLDVEEAARRAGILPGEVRDLLRRHGLENVELRLR